VPWEARTGRYEVGVTQAGGRAIESDTVHGTVPGSHAVTLKPMDPGRYILEVSVQLPGRITIAHNRLEFAVNPLPKSILIFGAHQDDDTAHPSIIRAAVENNIPIHLVWRRQRLRQVLHA
jgi:hypothetical protein